MKKIYLFLLLSGTVFSQSEGIRFVFQAGIATHESFNLDPTWGVASGQLAIHLNDFLILAPECSIWAPSLKVKPLQWAPGVTANYSFGDVFFGGGICRMIKTRDENSEAWSSWQIKAQIGYLGTAFAVTLFSLMDPDSLFRDMNVGVLVGFVL